MIGRRPRPTMSPTTRIAAMRKSSAVKSSFGWTKPRRWWGTPAHSSGVTLLVITCRPS
ncbi:hypothetical protein MA16_Dca017217 [Dendrobium catenatum]|uniref:Uncharacterized protein n=1 Tax=Dendrobium catenatum TaxID=906689 RepID=A0A2I0W2R0_9ASPA|nr:hypothetical protein MA16_Dca017217 [Dendrobium catenatum]